MAPSGWDSFTRGVMALAFLERSSHSTTAAELNFYPPDLSAYASIFAATPCPARSSNYSAPRASASTFWKPPSESFTTSGNETSKIVHRHCTQTPVEGITVLGSTNNRRARDARL